MRRIAISIGHVGPEDSKPAEHPEIGVTEKQTCLRIARILEALLGEYRNIDVEYAPLNQDLDYRITYLNALHGDDQIDLALELHMNAFHDRTVDGTEVLYLPTDMTGKAWAEKLQASLVGEVARKDRGAKAFDNEKRNGFIRLTDMPAVVVEPAFITNDQTAKEIVNGDLVHRIAWALFRALTS